MQDKYAREYWRANIRLLSILLSIWFFISFLCGIVLADWLDNIRFAGFKLGFWIAQQGSIYVFIGLILYYVKAMDKLDNKYRLHHPSDTNAGSHTESSPTEPSTTSTKDGHSAGQEGHKS
jgi:putative solute:sodium symporter small subunit